MFRKSFPMCCGADVLCDFGYTATSYGGPHRQNPETIRQFLIEEKKHNFGFLVAILNNTQMKNIGYIFLEEGFEVVSEGWNPNHPGTQPMRILVCARKKNGNNL